MRLLPISRLAALVFVAALAAPARAQLELPDRPVPAPSPAGAPVELAGKRGNLAERVTGKGQADREKEGQLVLPPPAPAKPAETPQSVLGVDSRATGIAAVISAAAGGPTTGGASAFILGELKKVKTIDSRLIDQAVQALLSLGDEGRGAARFALAADHPPILIAGAKVLLSMGDESDFTLIVTRLKGKLPPTAGPALLDAIVGIDPVRGGPRLLCELLGHPQGGVRATAARHLSAQLAPDALPFLSVALGCDQSDGRLKAVELVARLPGPEATRLLLERLKDRSPQVASRAATALAGREDPELDAELLNRAFRLQWILREGAYALVTIVQREDRRLQPILTTDHVDALLGGLGNNDIFVSGACAAALAGVGFRSPQSEASRWLDKEVPLRLLRVVAGQEFDNDATSLIEPARARLELITNQSFGSNGPRWVEWWNQNVKTFVAARAVIAVRPEEIGTLALTYRSSTGAADAFALIGPEAARPERAVGDVFRLSVPQVRELCDLVQRQGLLGVERLPGSRGSADGAGRDLEVRFGSRKKAFRFAGTDAEPWFETVASAAAALREKNRWQLFPDPELAAQGEAWLKQEGAWWDGEHDALERDQRLKTIVLRWLAAQPMLERAVGVEELQRLYAKPGVPESADFALLTQLLQQETAWGPRAQSLLALAEASARALPASAGAFDPALAHDLALVLGKSFGPASSRDIQRVLAAAGRPALRDAARAEEPFLRAVAANELARDPEEADLAVLAALIEDPFEGVRLAAIAAVGENRVESTRPRILVLAGESDPKVQAAALEALGKLGGDGAQDALMIGLSSTNESVQVSAVRGLASLGSPDSTTLFVSLLGRGRESPFFAPARDGLLHLGDAATADLLRAARAAGNKSRREAAILLAMRNVPQAAPILMTILTESPGDKLAAAELVMLTCVDFRNELNPASAWWTWWDGVVHDDAMAWLRAAMEKLSVAAPPAEAFGPEGTRAGLEFLLAVVARPEDWLSERGRRELSRLVGRDLGSMPPAGVEREAWIAALREKLSSRFP